MPNRFLFILLSILSCVCLSAREDSPVIIIPDCIYQAGFSADQFGQRIDAASSKLLQSLFKQETKQQRQAAKEEAAVAEKIFRYKEKFYEALQEKINKASVWKLYSPVPDSLSFSISFLQQQPQLLKQPGDLNQKIRQNPIGVNRLKSQIDKAKAIRQLPKRREQYLRQQPGNACMCREV